MLKYKYFVIIDVWLTSTENFVIGLRSFISFFIFVENQAFKTNMIFLSKKLGWVVVECYMQFALSRKFYFMCLCICVCKRHDSEYMWKRLVVMCDVAFQYERPNLIKSNFGEKTPWLKIEQGDILHITQQPKCVLIGR